MSARTPVMIAAWSVALAVLSLATPGTAEAQNRGTLQVSATIVDTRPSFDGLDAARSATRTWAQTGALTDSSAAQSLTAVRVQYTPGQPEPDRRRPAELVVTVEYSRS